jgi:hypothetical protein
MKRKVTILSVLAILLAGLFVSNSFAAIVATAAVTPSITAPGAKVFLVSNMNITNQAVSVTLSITNPGTCVTCHLPSQAGAFAFALRPRESRLADLSLDIPPSACSGTYMVTVLVKSSAGTVLASRTTKFTVTIP